MLKSMKFLDQVKHLNFLTFFLGNLAEEATKTRKKDKT